MVRHRRDDHKRLTFNIPEQEHILNTHINTLREWWSEAEHAPFREGDALIARFDDRPMPFEVYPADCDSDAPAENVRILARAPKPKPAWHDAPAVIASTDDGHVRQVWERNGDAAYWIGTEGYLVPAETLRDVTPLIEAKVTDEVVLRALNEQWDVDAKHLTHYSDGGVSKMRSILTAALGLETK